jgi:hypothetical protein
MSLRSNASAGTAKVVSEQSQAVLKKNFVEFRQSQESNKPKDNGFASKPVGTAKATPKNPKPCLRNSCSGSKAIAHFILGRRIINVLQDCGGSDLAQARHLRRLLAI